MMTQFTAGASDVFSALLTTRPTLKEEAIRTIDSGVLIWSTRSEDSAWCKKEYNSFEARQANGDFSFVAVRLQDAQLPSFVQGVLWIDAADQRDGPRGTSLLRLLYGLQSEPLPPDAVRLAARSDETTKQDLASIRSHSNSKDADEILRLRCHAQNQR